MFGSALLIFRQTLEAALILGIIAAATRGVNRRVLWLVIGVLLGLVGSGIVAALTETIASLADGSGQELFNAGVLGVAVVMLAWHNIWMSTHGAELARDAKKVGLEVKEGSKALSAIAVLVGLTVLREGAESVLFLHGIISSTPNGVTDVVMGALLGLGGGVLIGLMMFMGLMKIPVRWFFSVTGTLLLLLAAGLSSQMARLLIQADLLPALASPIWDTSGLLDETSLLGSILHVLIGYDARPSGMQLLFYVTTLAVITWLSAWVKKHPSAAAPAPAVAK